VARLSPPAPIIGSYTASDAASDILTSGEKSDGPQKKSAIKKLIADFSFFDF
jgi:hypothetical protein